MQTARRLLPLKEKRCLCELAALSHGATVREHGGKKPKKNKKTNIGLSEDYGYRCLCYCENGPGNQVHFITHTQKKMRANRC